MARKYTGLTPKNQRLMAKTIRRAVSLGLVPSSYQHPMILAETDMVPRSTKFKL
jgi:small subunit ribosomal protein S18